jgi:hypothetical protein
VLKWDLDLGAQIGGGANGVTPTPTVGNGLVYAVVDGSSSRRSRGSAIKWKYDTVGNVNGVQVRPPSPPTAASGRRQPGASCTPRRRAASPLEGRHR